MKLMLRVWFYRFATGRKANIAALFADHVVRTGPKPTGLKRFFGDTRGNIAVIFAIACVPLISAMGCAVDYAAATRMKSKLQSAADAAAVGAIAQGSPAYVAAGQMGSTGPITAGNTDASNIFNANINGVTGYANLVFTPNVTKTNTNITSSVSFTADVPTTFVGLIGFPKMSISGSSSAAGSLPMYLDFYVLLDVSGSMGLPSTTAEATRMQNVSPDDYVDYPTGCTLACHFTQQNSACNNPTLPPQTNSSQSGYPTNGYCLGYMISRVSQSGYQGLLTSSSTKKYNYKNPTTGLYQQLKSSVLSGLPGSIYSSLTPVTSCPTAGTDACIQLRLDAVGYAVNHLLSTANNPTYEKLPNQFRIGLYPFIRYVDTSYAPLTSSINGSSSTPGTINYAAANLAQELDSNTNSNLGSGGTHIDYALNTMNTTIVSPGNGSSSSNTLPFVFLITDGAQDNQVKAIGGSWSGSNRATVLNDPVNAYPNACTQLKNRNILVSVLYIPYQQINPTNTTFAGDEDDYANNNIPNIPTSLQTCASAGRFYTANTPQDIDNALQKMFADALLTAHLTN
jgi:Flp pilus assembly protein TadG